MLLGFILLYLLGTIAVGWWASRRVRSTRDFVIASGKLPLVVAGSALFATWFGSETILGASSEFVEHGLLGVIEDPFGAALCLFLVGAFYARRLYRLQLLTFNDFFRIRFGPTMEFWTSICIVPSYFGWIAAQLVAMAIVLQVVAGLPVTFGILLCTAVVVVYTCIGGMWAVSITDFIQTVMILIGLSVLAFVLWNQVGSWERLTEDLPGDFFQFLPERGWTNRLHYLAAWITIGLGSIPQQDVFQRVMAAKSAETSVKASYLGSIMYLTIGAIPLFIGLCARVLYPGLEGGDRQLVLPAMAMQYGDLWLQVLFFGALLSAILSTTSGAILAPATVIGENLIKPRIKGLSDRQVLFVMRISVVGVALCSALMAIRQSNIYDLVAQSSSLSLVSLFVPLTLGLFWKRASRMAGLCAMVAGLVAWGMSEWVGSELPAILWGLGASLLAMVVLSLLLPDNSYREFQYLQWKDGSVRE